MFRALSVLALGAVACAAPADTFLDHTFDPCEEIVVSPPIGLSAESETAIQRAFAMWNEVYATGLVLGEPGVPGDLPLHFEDAAPAFLGLYDDERGEIFINSRISGRSLEVTVAHELGHAFGSFHIDAYESVMNRGNTTIEPLSIDGEDLVERWGPCPRASDQ